MAHSFFSFLEHAEDARCPPAPRGIYGTRYVASPDRGYRLSHLRAFTL
jgi:hypothetical protein